MSRWVVEAALTDDMPLVVDLSGVPFAGSSLLHALLDARQRVALAGPLQSRFHRLLDLTGTAQQFTTTPQASAHLCGR
ncbi:hypothetical protein ACFVYT_39990 [Streptomyces sp. NPDC058290]|uniref:hypothetical protein n=1 Tax=Streptomyces sp. NPDC058290 TaxID=3346426 RepID=UPI0036EE9464